MSSPKTKSPTGPSSPASGPKSTPSPQTELIPAAENDDVRFFEMFSTTCYANVLERMFETTPTQHLKQTRELYSYGDIQSMLTTLLVIAQLPLFLQASFITEAFRAVRFIATSS